MEERTILKGKSKSEIGVGVTAGAITAIIALLICVTALQYATKFYIHIIIPGALILGLLVALPIIGAMKRVSLVVTDKRVYGCTASNERVDLPLDSISAVGTSWPSRIVISTASGSISFSLMANKDDLHECISKLLMQRESKPTQVIIENKNSNANELKEYKELLDSGVISQEEFDAKKKQLLNL